MKQRSFRQPAAMPPLVASRRRGTTTPAADARAIDVASVLAPVGLGFAQAVVAGLLVVVALAAPVKRDGFRGIANDTTSKGSGRRLELFRDAFGWLPGAGWAPSPELYLWGLRGALVALAVLQLGALLAALRTRPVAVGWWLLGPALTSLVLLVYPPLSADVFYYAISGHVANGGDNPYVWAPRDFQNDPFLRFNDWTTITSPYGPLWTDLSRVVVRLTGDDPLRAALAFKVVAALAGLGLAAATYALARRLTDDRRRTTGALVLVAWFPPLLIESAGTAHNDAAMMLCAVAGLAILARPGWGTTRFGLLLIAASALIKYVTLPLLLFAALVRVRRPERDAGLAVVAGRWTLDAAAVAGLTAVVFAPYWVGRSTIDSLVNEPARLFVNPLWVLPRLAVNERWGEATSIAFRDQTRTIGQWAVGIALAVVCLWLIARLWRGRPDGATDRWWLRAEAGAWAATTAALALVPVNAHAWYLVWLIAPVALAWAGARSGPPATTVSTAENGGGLGSGWRAVRWLLCLLVWTAVSFVVYHTRAPN